MAPIASGPSAMALSSMFTLITYAHHNVARSWLLVPKRVISNQAIVSFTVEPLGSAMLDLTHEVRGPVGLIFHERDILAQIVSDDDTVS